MRVTLALVLSIIVAVGIVAFGFTFFQVSSERNSLNNDLNLRAQKVTDELFISNIFLAGELARDNVDHFTDSLKARYNIEGISIYYSKDSIMANRTSRNFTNSSLEFMKASSNGLT